MLKTSRTITNVPARWGLPLVVICLASMITVAAVWNSSAQSVEVIEQTRALTKVAMPIADSAIGSNQLDASTFDAYEDSAGMVIRLSSERVLPFLSLGRPPTPDRPRSRSYGWPIDHFPDVRSCLVREERDAAKPELTAFDWKAMGDTTHAEVCIYRIATSYRDPEGFEAWIASQNLESIGRIEGAATGDPKEFIVRAEWPVKEKGTLLGLGSYIARKFTELLSYSLRISIRYKKNFGVINVGVSYLKK